MGAGILAVVLAAVCLRFWLQNRALRDDLARERETLALFPAGLPLGAEAPDFELPDLRGETRSLRSLLEGGRPLVLVFTDPGCGSCWALLPELGRWQAILADRLTLALLSTGSVTDNLHAEEHGLMNVLLQNDSEAMRAYRVDGTPSAVLVTSEGRIASEAAAGASAIEPLIRLTLRGEATVPPTGSTDGENGARSEQQRTVG